MSYESYKFKREKSQCRQCPLDGACTKVWGISGVKTPKVVILSDAPGSEENSAGEPFVGPAGRWLKEAVKRTDLPYYTLHKTHVLSCQPPGSDIQSSEALEAQAMCRPGMWEELQALNENGAKVLVPLGSTALKAVGLDGRINKLRGSVFPMKWHKGRLVQVESGDYDYLVVPTYHPSYIMRGMIKEETTWINDLIKAFEYARTDYKPPKENFMLFPTAKEIVKKLTELSKTKPLLGVDIEATSLVSHNASIIMVGLAWSEEDAIVVPFIGTQGGVIWKSEEREAIDKALRKVLEVCPTMYQNGLYDTRVLEANGYPVKNVKHDVLLLHHCINPELPHNLGYIVSSYGKTPFWKDVVLNDPQKMVNQDQEKLRRYNLRDCVVLHQVLPGLLEDLKQYASPKIYEEVSMGLYAPITAMMDNGMPLSKSRLRTLRKTLLSEVAELEERLRNELGLAHGFNLNSGQHLRWLLYSKKPPTFAKKRKQYSDYFAAGSKKSKTTKAFRELEAQIAAIEKTKPLPYLVDPAKSDSGNEAIDKRQMMNLQIALNNRENQIANLKKRTKKHDVEEIELGRLRTFLELFHQYQVRNKVLTTYTSFATGPDGRVHFPYKIHGTYTGRLASGDKKKTGVGNAQNIPSEVKPIFKAPDGHMLVQADYSNLELRILAAVSDDDVLQQAFDDYDAGKGPKPHEVNTRSLFDITPDDPNWKKYYRLSKTYIFGRNYGGSLRGIYEKIVQEDPSMDLTFRQFCELDEKYRAQHPKYEIWYNGVIKQVQKERRLENAFGRIRYFHGADHEIKREGLNFPIQSTASDVLNYSLIKVHQAFAATDTLLVATVHDSIILQSREESVEIAAGMLKKCMEQEFVINGKKLRFPVDVEAGPSWGELEEIKV